MESGPRARRPHDEPAIRGAPLAQQLEQVILEQLWHLPPAPVFASLVMLSACMQGVAASTATQCVLTGQLRQLRPASEPMLWFHTQRTLQDFLDGPAA